MSPQGPNPYLRTKILTASPEELRLMLFDGALKHARLARQTLAPDGGDTIAEKPDYEKLYEHVSRAQKIVLELSTSMKAEVAPEIVEKLTALYNYIYRLFIDVNMQRQLPPLDEAIRLLDFERQTWVMVMEKSAAERGVQPNASVAPAATSQQTALGAYSKSA